MLTEHVRLCAQYGIDVTKMTQVEAYVKLVECFRVDSKRLTNVAARFAACLWDYHDTCPECGDSRLSHMPGCAKTYERSFKGPRDTENAFALAFLIKDQPREVPPHRSGGGVFVVPFPLPLPDGSIIKKE